MSDITMCLNSDCRLNTQCLRYLATPNQLWQSYANFEKDTDENPCTDFLVHRILERMKNDKA